MNVGALKGDANSCGANVRRAEQKRCCFGEHHETLQAKGQRLVFPNRFCFLRFPICGALVHIFPVPLLPPRACFFNCCRAVKEQKAKSEPKPKRKPKKVKTEPPPNEEEEGDEIEEEEEQPPPPKKRKSKGKK